MLRRFFAVLPVLALVLASACGKTTTPGPVDTLCTDGAFQCFGNVSTVCNTGGKSYTVTQCGTDKFCNATSGKCEATVCEKGSSKCAGSDSSEVCSADGSTKTVKPCSSAEMCLGGICVSKTCGGTQQKCGWNATLTCSAKAWAKADCKAGEMCDPATFTCKPRACDGSTTQCNDDKTSAAVCSDAGEWVVSACGGGNICQDGICHPEVSGTTVEDTASGTDGDAMSLADTKDGKTILELPPKDIQLDAPDLFQCVISQSATAPDGATPMVLTNASAAWLDTIQTLQITGAEGTTKVEIQVKGPDFAEFSTGTYTAVGAEAPDSLIGYSDGTGEPGKFQYQAADYTISVDEFGDVGGRIKGTFTAQLADGGGKKVWLLDGKFDIKR